MEEGSKANRNKDMIQEIAVTKKKAKFLSFLHISFREANQFLSQISEKLVYEVAGPVASNLAAWQGPLQEVISFFGPSEIFGGTDKLFWRKNILLYLKKNVYIIQLENRQSSVDEEILKNDQTKLQGMQNLLIQKC